MSLTIIVKGCNQTVIVDSNVQIDSRSPTPWESEDVSGTDSLGREAEFVVQVLSEEHRWSFASHDSLETGLAADVIPEYLSQLDRFDAARGVIVVGAASQEGDQAQEIDRSERRADTLAGLLRLETGTRNLYKLVLGQHQIDTRRSDTSYQRRVTIIGIMSAEAGMSTIDIRDALEDALGNRTRFSLRPELYSVFSLMES